MDDFLSSFITCNDFLFLIHSKEALFHLFLASKYHEYNSSVSNGDSLHHKSQGTIYVLPRMPATRCNE